MYYVPCVCCVCMHVESKMQYNKRLQLCAQCCVLVTDCWLLHDSNKTVLFMHSSRWNNLLLAKNSYGIENENTRYIHGMWISSFFNGIINWTLEFRADKVIEKIAFPACQYSDSGYSFTKYMLLTLGCWILVEQGKNSSILDIFLFITNTHRNFRNMTK